MDGLMENGSVHEVFGGWEMGRLGAYDVLIKITLCVTSVSKLNAFR